MKEKKKISVWTEWMVVYALTIAFVLQKLTDSIDWSWWWVLSPILFMCGVYVSAFIFVFFWYQISKLFKYAGTSTGFTKPVKMTFSFEHSFFQYPIKSSSPPTIQKFIWGNL